MTEVIKLQNCVMKRMEVKVSRGLPLCCVIGRILNGGEVLRLKSVRNNNHSARMLTGRALDTGAADCEPCLLRTGNLSSPFVKVLFDEAECRFIRNRSDCTRLENMGRAEKLFGILMRP